MPTIPMPRDGEPLGALVPTRPGIKQAAAQVLREIRPDLDDSGIDQVIRNTRWAPQAVLVSRPMNEIEAVAKAVRDAGVSCKAIKGHDGSYWPPPPADDSSETATLMLRRAFLISDRPLDALAVIRPDLGLEQIKELVKGEWKSSKSVLTDRPLMEVEVAAKVLKRLGLRVEVVRGEGG
ncbi:hypothetical protein [Parafrankia discariae]|uniref:hypothetical protein n=1 Tax=Parafrankia discariae TaxID=365528 RepID=UPI0003A59F5A|nr:hypothetical protein [Parafrankia discariae]